MTDETVDVSIIICTRNRSSKLSAALKALASLRGGKTWEALLVDNASTDDTAGVISRADNCGGRIKYLRVERVGLGAARDAAWRSARGRIIAFTDDDCYVATDYVEAISGAFERRPEVACLGGRILLFDSLDARVTIDEGVLPRSLPPRTFIAAGDLQGANLAFRREALEAIGGFDPAFGAGTLFPCEDVDAVAATVWKGFPAGFEPAATVYHHHGRRAGDITQLLDSYDRGRGAYYAKYILRSDTRSAYIHGWIRMSFCAKTVYFFSDLRVLVTEWLSALRYLNGRGATIASISLAICGAAAVSVMGGWILVLAAGRRVARMALLSKL
jgi:glycosyltransferase involved in cell wall biosynthesis